jgi:hypothetical protein
MILRSDQSVYNKQENFNIVDISLYHLFLFHRIVFLKHISSSMLYSDQRKTDLDQ